MKHGGTKRGGSGGGEGKKNAFPSPSSLLLLTPATQSNTYSDENMGAQKGEGAGEGRGRKAHSPPFFSSSLPLPLLPSSSPSPSDACHAVQYIPWVKTWGPRWIPDHIELLWTTATPTHCWAEKQRNTSARRARMSDLTSKYSLTAINGSPLGHQQVVAWWRLREVGRSKEVLRELW